MDGGRGERDETRLWMSRAARAAGVDAAAASAAAEGEAAALFDALPDMLPLFLPPADGVTLQAALWPFLRTAGAAALVAAGVALADA